MVNTLIQLTEISKYYPAIRALEKVNLSVPERGIIGLLGPNGAGKTTLIRIMLGLIAPSSGQIAFNWQSSVRSRPQIGYLPDSPPLYHNLRVSDYLDFVAQLYQVPNGIRHKRKIAVLEQCRITDLAHRLIGNLSRGQQQRIGLAQALIFDPPLIILDEPLVGLDPAARAEIRQLIQSWQTDRAVIISGHQLLDLELICTDIVILNHGKLLLNTPVAHLADIRESGLRVAVEVKQFDPSMAVNLVQAMKDRGIKMEIMDSKVTADQTTEVIFAFTGADDYREQLAQQLVWLNAGILAFHKQTRNLEEVFTAFTKGVR